MIENNIKELRTEFSKPFITHAQKLKQGYLMYPIRRMPEKSFSNTQKINNKEKTRNKKDIIVEFSKNNPFDRKKMNTLGYEIRKLSKEVSKNPNIEKQRLLKSLLDKSKHIKKDNNNNDNN